MSKPFHDFAKEAEKLSPLSIMSEQTKASSCINLLSILCTMTGLAMLRRNAVLCLPGMKSCCKAPDHDYCCSKLPGCPQEQAKNALKSNWRKIVRCFLEASIYCALYHHATEELKKRTKKRRWVLLILVPHPLIIHVSSAVYFVHFILSHRILACMVGEGEVLPVDGRGHLNWVSAF